MLFVNNALFVVLARICPCALSIVVLENNGTLEGVIGGDICLLKDILELDEIAEADDKLEIKMLLEFLVLLAVELAYFKPVELAKPVKLFRNMTCLSVVMKGAIVATVVVSWNLTVGIVRVGVVTVTWEIPRQVQADESARIEKYGKA